MDIICFRIFKQTLYLHRVCPTCKMAATAMKFSIWACNYTFTLSTGSSFLHVPYLEDVECLIKTDRFDSNS